MSGNAWSVAVFTSREDAATLCRTVDAVIAASASHATTIDVLADGNPGAAANLSPLVSARVPPGSTLRVWSVPWRDKACTWNRYLHEIAPAADVAFFVDGYVRPRFDSMALLAGALVGHAERWAASGVPTCGRSAATLRKTLLTEGGLHGNLYALSGSVVTHLRRCGFGLPLGLYRNDSLIGAVAAFAGAPTENSWDPKRRIAVVPDATWEIDIAAIGWARLRGDLRRRMRQAQGRLENAAVREHLAVRKRPPETLPRTIEALLATVPSEAIAWRGIGDWLLIRKAARRVSLGQDWSRCERPAELLLTWEGK